MSDLRAWSSNTNNSRTRTFRAGLGRVCARPHTGRLPVIRIEVSGQWIYATVKHTDTKRTYLWHRGQMAFELNSERHELTVADHAQQIFSTRYLFRRALAVVLTAW